MPVTFINGSGKIYASRALTTWPCRLITVIIVVLVLRSFVFSVVVAEGINQGYAIKSKRQKFHFYDGNLVHLHTAPRRQ